MMKQKVSKYKIMKIKKIIIIIKIMIKIKKNFLKTRENYKFCKKMILKNNCQKMALKLQKMMI